MAQRYRANLVRWWQPLRRLLIIVGALTVVIALVRWGGTARPGPLFIAGVALLSGLLLAFGLLIAWLYGGPQPTPAPLMRALLIYPPINGYTVPRMSAISVLMGLAGGWAGARLGGWLGALKRVTAPEPVRRPTLLLALGGSGVAALVLLLIVLTAQPPVAAGSL